ncbi:MAG: hypothetical protein ING39_06450 [Burkholderiales bacterium]|jgi:hypothetical protein|nr:hypothetical protein [Burkholderiales bacterium]
MRKRTVPIALLVAIVLSGCAIALKTPTLDQSANLAQFKFVVIEPTQAIVSVSGSAGNVSSKDFNPGTFVEGMLLKRGIIRVPAVTPATSAETLVLRWGVSGRRDILLGLGGYTQEVTFAFLRASTMEPVYRCSAEGIGSTEADDIREALNTCLSAAR